MGVMTAPIQPVCGCRTPRTCRPLAFAVRDASTLRLLDVAGRPIVSDLNYDLTRSAARQGVAPEAREMLEPALAELRDLAQAALQGAQQAAEQVRAIVQAARSLQTYDSRGRRHVTTTQANLPQRF